MVQYLEELKGIATPPLSKEELIELEQLRNKYEKLKQRNAARSSANAKVKVVAAKKKAKDSDSGSSSDSEVSLEAPSCSSGLCVYGEKFLPTCSSILILNDVIGRRRCWRVAHCQA